MYKSRWRLRWCNDTDDDEGECVCVCVCVCVQWTVLDPILPEVKDLICQSLSEVDCSRWRQCCEAGVQCCQRQSHHGNRAVTSQRSAANHTPASDRCEMTWDGYTCWPDTPAGQLEMQDCPTYMPLAQPFSMIFFIYWRIYRYLIIITRNMKNMPRWQINRNVIAAISVEI